VVNQVTGAPIAGATVRGTQGSLIGTTLSGNDGRYSLSGFEPGRDVTLSASAPGYQTFTITQRASRGSTALTIQLTPLS
jgi:hypothetical protein